MSWKTNGVDLIEINNKLIMVRVTWRLGLEVGVWSPHIIIVGVRSGERWPGVAGGEGTLSHECGRGNREIRSTSGSGGLLLDLDKLWPQVALFKICCNYFVFWMLVPMPSYPKCRRHLFFFFLSFFFLLNLLSSLKKI